MPASGIRDHASLTSLVGGPTAPDSATFARWQEGARRRRLLEGLWKTDLRNALAREYDPTRRRMLGPPDTTKNLFRSLITQLAVLYDRAPVIEHSAGAQVVEELGRVTSQAGLWQLAIHLQQLTLGMREGLYRFDVPPSSDPPQLLVRVVPTDLVWADAPADDPDNPHTVIEYRQRTGPQGSLIWTRDVLSIEDPEAPVFRVESQDGKLDLSDAYLPGDLSGDNYPYRKADRTPILPFSLYHASRTGHLWDPFRGIELVDGTLTVAGLWTQWRHLVRDASWPQRWTLNAVPDGLEANRATGDLAVTTDPSTVLSLRPKVPGQSSSVGQFQPGGDPASLGDAIRAYGSDLLQDFDLSPSDISRTHTDARSGYAIEVTREGQRRAQRRLEPQFKRGDQASLAIVATLWNRATGSNLPEDGWSVRYLGLPLSMEERRLVMDDHRQRAELGIASKVQLLAAVEGITEDQARRRLVEIEIDMARFRDPAPTGPTPQPGPTVNREPED